MTWLDENTIDAEMIHWKGPQEGRGRRVLYVKFRAGTPFGGRAVLERLLDTDSGKTVELDSAYFQIYHGWDDFPERR